MSYALRLASAAEKDLHRVPRDVLGRVDAKLMALKRNPRPRGASKLEGRQGLGWRVRVGDYRILYTIDDEAKIVSVYRVSPRGSAYKR